MEIISIIVGTICGLALYEYLERRPKPDKRYCSKCGRMNLDDEHAELKKEKE
jgi:hypothetical protein